MSNTRHTIRNAFVVLLFLGVCGYGVYQALPFLNGPEFTIHEPINGMTATSTLQEIHGSTKNVYILRLNGRIVPLNEHNDFTDAVLLSPGINRLFFHAEDKFKHVKEQTIEVLYRDY